MSKREEKDIVSGYIHIGGEDAIEQIQLGQEESALQFVVVERHLPRAGAVQASLHECGPGVFQQEPSPNVILADPGSSGEHCFPTVMFHSIFSEKEVGEISNVVRRHKVWF
jgi:hypothetical protein